MTLSDTDIQTRLSKGDLVVTPDPHIGPCSVDLRLGDSFATIKAPASGFIALDQECAYDVVKQDIFTLFPHQFVLASTIEYLEIPADLRGKLDGRSSIGRKGLFIHNAGFFDPGFKGEATLELFNATEFPFVLRKGQRICQIEFTLCTSPVAKPYCGKYNGQRGATGSRSHEDREYVGQ